MSMVFALAGNQNSGKTTLFNQLTGSNQHVGNFPGVTVDKKEGVIRDHHAGEHHRGLRSWGHPRHRRRDIPAPAPALVVDLPGIYSLSPYTSEEIVTRDFILNEKPDGIINIVDATNIERNLYLSMQLIELGIPMVIALNMMDEMRANGSTVDVNRLEEELGVAVVPISAAKNEGIDELIEHALRAAEHRDCPKRQDFCTGAVHRCIHGIAHMVEDHAEAAGIPRYFAATKLVEGDEPMQRRLKLTENELDLIDHSVKEMEDALGTDREAALADMRYSFIEKLCAETVVKHGESREHARSVARLVPVSTAMVLTTASLAVKPVMRAVEARQSEKPRGAKTGATTRPRPASILAEESATTLSRVSKDCKNQMMMVATKMTVKARVRKSLALSHTSRATLLGLGTR